MSSGYRHYENTQRLSVASETAAAMGVANLQNWEPAVEEVHGWPGYEPQPLWAGAVGVEVDLVPADAEEPGLRVVRARSEGRGPTKGRSPSPSCQLDQGS
jgi:hypothetical protein